MTIKTRVTSPVLVCNTQVHHQWHRSHRYCFWKKRFSVFSFFLFSISLRLLKSTENFLCVHMEFFSSVKVLWSCWRMDWDFFFFIHYNKQNTSDYMSPGLPCHSETGVLQWTIHVLHSCIVARINSSTGPNKPISPTFLLMGVVTSPQSNQLGHVNFSGW